MANGICGVTLTLGAMTALAVGVALRPNASSPRGSQVGRILGLYPAGRPASYPAKTGRAAEIARWASEKGWTEHPDGGWVDRAGHPHSLLPMNRSAAQRATRSSARA